MELWRNPPEIDVSLQLPSQNGFIPTDFSIRANDISNDLVTVTSPTCIIDEPLVRFWYKLDNTFKLPRVNTYFRINLKGGYDNVKNCILTELFIHLLKDELNEIIYQVSRLSFIKNEILLLPKFWLIIFFILDRYDPVRPSWLTGRYV